jgi:chromosome partitioning protein
MTRVLAVANQKGGVAKTTTAHSLGVALAELGERVLLVDLDPQACLTYSVGIDPDTLEGSLHDVLAGRTDAADVLTKAGDLAVLPATIDLAGAEVHLMSKTGREHVLARALRPLVGDYDTVFIDCPPSLGILTINGLTAAHQVIIPLLCETLGQRGVGQLLETIGDVRSFTNAKLKVRGLVATMFDSRTRHGREVLDSLEERYGIEVLQPPVPKSVRFAEAPGRGRSILEHAPRSAGAEAYRTIARTLHQELR